MQNHPFFTVLVPTYNQAQYLGAALDSLLAQTDPDWEVIVVNDGSTDATSEVIAEYCRRDKRFHAIHKENGGVASALNAGLRQARGAWVCWLSSDDLFEVHKLAVHREWIGRHPDCRFFFTDAKLLEDMTGEISSPKLTLPSHRKWQLLEMLRCGFIYGNSICVNREAWARVGEFDEGLRNGQDYDMWLRLLAQYPGTFIPERTCITRCHALQDSKRFVMAGVFDSAVAAIRFLNQHRFDELVPLVDIGEEQWARKAAAEALDVAADSSAYLYALGPHPALLLRIMEWAWSCSDEAARSLQGLVRRRISDTRWQYAGTPFGFYWKVADAAAHLSERRFEYQEIAPLEVASHHFHLLTRAGRPEASMLGRYLARFEYPIQDHPRDTVGLTKEIVIVCQSSSALTTPVLDADARAAVRFAKYAMNAGREVLLMGMSPQGIGLVDGVPILGIDSDETLARALRRLGRVGAVIGLSRPDVLKMANSERFVIYDGGDAPLDDASVDLLNRLRTQIVCSSEERRAAHIGHGVLPGLIHVADTEYEIGPRRGPEARSSRSHAVECPNTLLDIIESTSRRRSAGRVFLDALSHVTHVRALARRLLTGPAMKARSLVWLSRSTPISRWPRTIGKIWMERRERRSDELDMGSRP